MNTSTRSSAIHSITALINANGPAYPARHPAEFLEKLVQELGDDSLVGALYYSCLCGIFKEAARKSVSLESLTAEIRVADREKLLGLLQKVLPNFAYSLIEEIEEAIAKQLSADLDGEFEEFCTDDDYYEPVVEDYDFEYDLKECCRKYGLQARDFSYEGSDEGFEPYFRGGKW